MQNRGAAPTRRRTTVLWCLTTAAVAILASFTGALAPAVAAAPPDATSSPAATSGDVSWGVAPANNANGSDRPHFDYTLDPGATLADELVVTNHSDHPIMLDVYAADAFTTSNGAIDVLPAGKPSTDSGLWVAVASPTVTVDSGVSVAVPFTLRVPASATPGDHPAGIVTALVEPGTGSGVQVQHRLGARIYLRVTGTLSPSLAVTDVRADFHGVANPFAPGSATVTYTVRNTGNVRLGGRESVTVAGPGGVLSRNLATSDLPEILPGGSLTRTATVTGVWPAFRMTADVAVTPADESDGPLANAKPALGHGVSAAVPWSQLALLLLVVGATVGGLRLRRRRRAAIRATVAAAVAKALADRDSTPVATSATAVDVADVADASPV